MSTTPADGASGDGLEPSGDSRNVHYAQLRREIVTGQMPPGSPLYENAMSARLGVSRAPVRDAILRLEADGLVERGPRGAVVRRRTTEEIFDIYQARIALEAEAAASAAERATKLDLDRLALLHERTVDETTPATEARQLHTGWHRLMVAASHNQTIIEVLDRLVLQLSPYETPSLADSDNLSHTHSEHADLLDAIRSGEGDRARELVTVHLRRTRDVRINALLREEDNHLQQ